MFVLFQLWVLQAAVWMVPLVDKWPVFLRGWTTPSGRGFEECVQSVRVAEEISVACSGVKRLSQQLV